MSTKKDDAISESKSSSFTEIWSCQYGQPKYQRTDLWSDEINLERSVCTWAFLKASRGGLQLLTLQEVADLYALCSSAFIDHILWFYVTTLWLISCQSILSLCHNTPNSWLWNNLKISHLDLIFIHGKTLEFTNPLFQMFISVIDLIGWSNTFVNILDHLSSNPPNIILLQVYRFSCGFYSLETNTFVSWADIV